MKWTKEQLEAITSCGTNIIVSAGAGSGKTAVLTERVYQKLQSGINITDLLVLTFTNAAAASMKKKIRKKISEDASLKYQEELLDSAYICTFDSFSLSLVKKYHTYLNITNNIEITDDVIIDLEKRNILDKILEEKYSNPTDRFKLLINNFCLKDDEDLIKYILNIYSKIELKYNKDEYLSNYIDNFNDEKIDIIIDEYLKLIYSHFDNIKIILNDLKTNFDGDYYTKIESLVSNLLELKDYSLIKTNINVELPRVPNNSTDYQKTIKESLKKELDKIKDLCSYNNLEEAKEEILSTKDNLEEVVSILIELNNRLTKYKNDNNIYNFNDIAQLAIKIVQENEDIKNELVHSFNEILIDEYQDTSDTQEMFISLISNNNVYMVGDIKQSIYRFRNANPYIFKDKYDLYSNTNNGIKIDLLKNFRSRKEVLENINSIFNRIMSDEIGGANYLESHNMIFGNNSYEEEGKTTTNNYLDIINYELKDKKYSSSEYEAFIIANDIAKKIKSKYLVFDKDKKELKTSTYKDYCIMIDKSKDFDLYKEVFSYFGIPLTIIRDNELTKENDIYVISNLIKLIINIKNNNYDNNFIYSFISISRSFLIEMSDKDIYDIYINNSYKDTMLFTKCLELSKNIDKLPPEDFYELMLNSFNYEEKLIRIGNIDNYLMKEEYIYNLIRNFSKTGKTIYEFSNYLDEIFDNELNIRFKTNNDSTNSVKIMTIHASKGLEFPICYYSGFTSKFNLPEYNDRIYYDNNYGIVIPKINEFYKDTILKTITKTKGIKEDISERIRLLYVALTRAEEKMIIVLPNNDNESDYKEVPNYLKEKYYSFEKILDSINSSLDKYKSEVEPKLTKDYQSNKKITNFDNLLLKEDNLSINEIKIESNLVEEKHFSKENLKIQTKEEKSILDYGTKVHEILEVIDFSNYDLELFDISKDMKDKIISFINSNIIQSNINNKMYKEYEFITKEDNDNLHGIIDLLIEKDDSYIIIDYKLKNIDDSNYDKQLNGYKKFIENKTNKKVSCYLYSIMDEKFREVK